MAAQRSLSAPIRLEQRNSSNDETSTPGSDLPEEYGNLNELLPTGSIGVSEESPARRTLEGFRGPRRVSEPQAVPTARERVLRWVTELYVLSYLVFFSIFGTLARVGLTALTFYPGSPVVFSTLWANVGGSVVMGFLVQDQRLFRDQGHDKNHQEATKKSDVETGDTEAERRKAHMAVKKTIPLYVGLSTGFCGSFTSFSTFIRDAFLAISNDLPTPSIGVTPDRNGGYSVMALLAVILTTTAMSFVGFVIGVHLAMGLGKWTPRVPHKLTHRFLDPAMVIVGLGSWLGAVFLAIFPPADAWRGRVVFAIVFAPLGCVLRFYLSLFLNGKIASFPLGTFVANVFGTAVLGTCWDIAHAQVGGVVGCQVLQGVEDGFCGCLTTISTWVVELSALRKRHAYVYGSTSVVVALAVLIAIMGGLRWSDGFDALLCST
ncbi:CrcB-like protein-domain-containing protein [Emericellopsis atlantica]|uniref:CrcB-like protein-domain-containing protein n=1 Tax=Emericellopsis atlantica TaxID=2614577 RepID=A0A9P7ZHW6_9HYPO|nr:CrcB-like protein-domain-containing protein [Emericellopsis atlantica]KAG9252221.1 CrcB-like protein-domain-containing protein [Emericellopsis atlantica]